MSTAGRAAIDRWYREYAYRVVEYLEHRTDPQTAEDLLQEVFILAHRKYPDIPEPPIGWLLSTASKLLANTERGNQRHDTMVRRVAEQAGQAGDPGDAELKLRFVEALSELSHNDQEVLTLTGWYGLTPAQAAEALGCSQRAYAVRLHRARARLSDSLKRAAETSSSAAERLAAVLRD